MSYEYVIKASKKLEAFLSSKGAEGKGLHEKLTSIESNLNENLVKKIRYLATVRNKLIHEDGYELTQEEFANFQEVNISVGQLFEEMSLEKEMLQKLLESRDCLCKCPGCHKDILPEAIYRNGKLIHSQCLFCGHIIKNLKKDRWFNDLLDSFIISISRFFR